MEANLPDEKKPKITEKKKKTMHGILREMQNLPKPPMDFWRFDGIYEDESFKSYESTFYPILHQMGFDNFQELVESRSTELGRKVEVVDLFGGAYFIPNLEHVSRIVGVRLGDIDIPLSKNLEQQALLDLKNTNGFFDKYKKFKNLINDPRRVILEGNLYKGQTWNDLIDIYSPKESKGFDIVVCRPQGPFVGQTNIENITTIKDEEQHKEEIFIQLLDRALNLLSRDGGILLTQTPVFSTHPDLLMEQMRHYMEKKKKEGYEFLLNPHNHSLSNSILAVIRTVE